MNTLTQLTLTDLPEDDRKAVPFRKNRFTIWLSRKLYPLTADEADKWKRKYEDAKDVNERLVGYGASLCRKIKLQNAVIGQYKAGRNPSQRALKEVESE